MSDKTAYELWTERQGLPIVAAYGVEDVRELPRAPWRLSGGRASFIALNGMEGLTGMVVGEIPPRSALRPEKHLYEEVIAILEGSGATEVWSPQRGNSKKLTFEWQKGSVFAPPLNCPHQLHNGGGEPVVYLAVTSAPLIFDLFRDEKFIFNSNHTFTDRFAPEPDYFTRGERLMTDIEGDAGMLWTTNLIADVRTALVDPVKQKGAGVKITCFEMGGNGLVGHLADWPAGRYHKAHHHGGGAVLLIWRSRGYTLMWPQEAGPHPYADGKRDRVVRVKWHEGAVVSPPTGWFHQHFNTGEQAALQLAIRWGSMRHDVGFNKATRGTGVYVDYRQGGTLIEYEDEDPRIRADFEKELRRGGLESTMPPVARRSVA
jgi:mannose-6-phosphate isomerase-like protein (cupin superfamily)